MNNANLTNVKSKGTGGGITEPLYNISSNICFRTNILKRWPRFVAFFLYEDFFNYYNNRLMLNKVIK